LNAGLRHVVLHDALRQRRVQHWRAGIGDEPAEFENKRRSADRLRPARDDAFNPHAKYVALLGAFDEDRSVLRIDEGESKLLRWPVVDGLDRPSEGVEGLGYNGVAGRNRQDRRRVGAVDVLVGTLLRLGQVVSRASLAAG